MRPAPRWPAMPGIDTCAVPPTAHRGWASWVPCQGRPIELTVADFTDGPWCGAGDWRFDADLFRVRAVRFAVRLQATSPGVRGQHSQWFALPGTGSRLGQEVRDVELDVFVTAPNLAWAQ